MRAASKVFESEAFQRRAALVETKVRAAIGGGETISDRTVRVRLSGVPVAAVGF